LRDPGVAKGGAPAQLCPTPRRQKTAARAEAGGLEALADVKGSISQSGEALANCERLLVIADAFGNVPRPAAGATLPIAEQLGTADRRLYAAKAAGRYRVHDSDTKGEGQGNTNGAGDAISRPCRCKAEQTGMDSPPRCHAGR
jgi:hypothetical protein